MVGPEGLTLLIPKSVVGYYLLPARSCKWPFFL